jgi:hypothetical protein
VNPDPPLGALAETWCFGEVLKARRHRGLPADLWFWRSSDGYEPRPSREDRFVSWSQVDAAVEAL